MKICVSVVVPTCRRPALLRRCLQALFAQDFEPCAYEVIVVDDAPCEETRRLVEGWCGGAAAREGRLRYVPVQGTHGPAAARNLGWRAARGEIIAFTDDDCIPDPRWLRAGLRAFVEGVEAVSGRIIVPLTSAPTDYEYNAAHLAHAEFVTANCFYRRSALEALGGFDERFTTAWREDTDLFFRLLKLNAKCLHAPEARVIHPVRPADWGVSLRQQRKSLFNALLYKKHPQLYRRHIQARPPWHYYGCVGALLLCAVCLLMQCWPPALGALCLWAWLTGNFCAQRLRKTSHAPAHVLEMIITSILITPLSIYWRLRGALKFRVFFL